MSRINSYMKMAYELGELGRAYTSPNPFVGCVIVKDDVIVGQGRTQPWGKDHAEVQALKEAKELAKGAEMYVTLEPCAHYGKTPPCAKAIIEAGIKVVYAGIKDPNPKVNGKGFQMLQDAGVEVHYGFMQNAIRKQLEYYLTYITQERPFVYMKNAVSLDSKIADDNGNSKWITSSASRRKVHYLRNEADAIITGVKTVNEDDAMLNVRLDDVEISNPSRVVVDKYFEINIESKLVVSSRDIATMIFTSSQYRDSKKHLLLESKGLQVVFLDVLNNTFNLQEITAYLYNKNMYSVMIEAGPQLCSSFLAQGLIDKIYYFIAPSIIDGNMNVFSNIGIDSIENKIQLELDSIERIDNDVLLTYYLN